jgi:predicted Zn-dependent peptidase
MEKHQLKNGIRVVLEHIPTYRSVALGIWVKAGSRHETESTNGISHFIEHMLFKGTPRYSAQEIANCFDGIGGQVNAFTSKEYTCYFAKVLDEHMPRALDVLADMFFHSLFAAEELQKEKNVIMEEISMYEDTPDDLVHDILAKATYDGHPLSYSILGTSERLQQMQRNDLIAHIGHHYTNEAIVISVAGHLDATTMDRLEQAFGHYENRTPSRTVEAPHFRSGHMFLEKKTEQHHLCMAFPGCSLSDDLLYAMILFNNVVGGGMSSRLFQTIREQRGLAYSVYSYHTSHQDSGLFTLYAGIAPKHTYDVLSLMRETLDDLAQQGMTDEELRRGKEQMKGSLILGLESANSRMTRNGKNELMNRRLYTLDELMHGIEAVTHDDIRQLTTRLFCTKPATALVGHTEDALVSWRKTI